MTIQNFKDRNAQWFFYAGFVRKTVGWANLKTIVRRKLDILNYASQLKDLEAPPGNRLEALKADLVGFYSIRINEQWRIIFKWTETGPSEVKIIDYH